METFPSSEPSLQGPASSAPSQPEMPAPVPPQAPAAPGRDPDLVALEGFESEFADLEVELERVERTSVDRDSTPPTG